MYIDYTLTNKPINVHVHVLLCVSFNTSSKLNESFIQSIRDGLHSRLYYNLSLSSLLLNTSHLSFHWEHSNLVRTINVVPNTQTISVLGNNNITLRDPLQDNEIKKGEREKGEREREREKRRERREEREEKREKRRERRERREEREEKREGGERVCTMYIHSHVLYTVKGQKHYVISSTCIDCIDSVNKELIKGFFQDFDQKGI